MKEDVVDALAVLLDASYVKRFDDGAASYVEDYCSVRIAASMEASDLRVVGVKRLAWYLGIVQEDRRP